MRTWLKWLNVVWLWAMVPALYAGNTPREVLNLNPSWKYSRGDDAGAARPAYDDSAWERVGLPHSFSIPYFMSKDFYVGYGWYRRGGGFDREAVEKRKSSWSSTGYSRRRKSLSTVSVPEAT